MLIGEDLVVITLSADHPSVRPRVCGCHGATADTGHRGRCGSPPWPVRCLELRNGRNARRQALDERQLVASPGRISPSNFYRE